MGRGGRVKEQGEQGHGGRSGAGRNRGASYTSCALAWHGRDRLHCCPQLQRQVQLAFSAPIGFNVCLQTTATTMTSCSTPTRPSARAGTS